MAKQAASTSCALSPPCPVPPWEPTWQLNLSTAIQPANSSGFLDLSVISRFGLVSLDWSNAHALWYNANTDYEICEELLLAQAAAIKAVNPKSRVFVYRNLELALEWMTTQRRVMKDDSNAEAFLRYANGTIYDEPRMEGSQYFWNYSSSLALDLWTSEIATNDLGVSSPFVDGIFTDDVTGIPAEHPNIVSALHLSPSEIQTLQEATDNAYTSILSSVMKLGSYNWQAFGAQDGTNSLPTSAQDCTAKLPPYIASYSQPRIWGLATTSNGSYPLIRPQVAAFLVLRGPHQYIGTGWSAESTKPTWNDLFDLDVGLPTSNATQIASNVYSRNFTNGHATIDCNTFTGTLAFN